MFSWESAHTVNGGVTVTGTEGTLSIPNPNHFTGPLRSSEHPRKGGLESDPLEGVTGGRGLGIAEMVRSIRADEPHRASAELGLHVLDIMAAIERSIATGEAVPIVSRVERPALLPADWDPYEKP